MPVTFVLGRAGAGKTRYCIDALLAELARPETRRLILLVPEQASFQMERTLAVRAPRHGYLRAEVLSFSRLARRIFADTGREPAVLRPAARSLALRCAAAGADAALRVFGRSARTPGFFAQLDGLIEELLLENVSPPQLARAAERLDDAAARGRVAALAALYARYLEWLGAARIDPAQRLALLRQRLAAADWLSAASIWVDGFAGFTGQELETLVALARLARDVWITLLLDAAAPSVRDARLLPDVLGLFHRTETTYQRLVQRLSAERVELRPPVVLADRIPPRFALADELARLEAELARPVGVAETAPRPAAQPRRDDASLPQVRIVECRTHREELRAAAHTIRRQIADSNGALRFRDFAVIARDLEPFAPLVADVFAEYGLPHFLDRRRPLATHVLSRFVAALLEAVRMDFPVAAATRLLRCGLLPLSRAAAERLENAVVAGEVRGFSTWCRPRWDFAGPRLDAARTRLAHALTPLVRRARAIPPPTAADWARTLYATLGALGVRRRIGRWVAEARRARDWETAEVHRLAWDALCDVLDDLHDLLGPQPIALDELAAVIVGELRELSVGLAPPTLDQVLVGAIERSRHPDIKYAWVFAFNDGIFPAEPAADTLLSTAERERLLQAGLPAPRPRRQDVFAERLLAYIALTRPSHGLVISYATVGEDGAPRFPSPLLAEVQRALPHVQVERATWDDPPLCLEEFARHYLRLRETSAPAASAMDVLRRRYGALRTELQASAAARPRLAWLLRGLTYRNAPPPIPGYTRAPDGAGDEAAVAWCGSPTELETHLQCPFKHFATYGLRLDPLRGPPPMLLELGRRAHQVLAAVTEQALTAGEPVQSISDARWLSFLDAALQQLDAQQPPDLAERRPHAAFQARALGSFLRELVLVHAERWRRGRFVPLACERRFDPDGGEQALRALELATPDGRRIRVHGVIDRIDGCQDAGRTRLLVYDYKSSPAGTAREYLSQDWLQLLTYLLAVQAALGEGGDTEPAGVLAAPLYPDGDVLARRYVTEASEIEQRMYLYRPRGLFAENVARLLDTNLDDRPSPVANMRLTKDGRLSQNADARPPADVHAFLELARRTVLHVGQRLADGRIDVAPLLENRTLACQRCDFRPVCRFDTFFNRPRVAEHSLPTLEQVCGAAPAADETDRRDAAPGDQGTAAAGDSGTDAP